MKWPYEELLNDDVYNIETYWDLLMDGVCRFFNRKLNQRANQRKSQKSMLIDCKRWRLYGIISKYIERISDDFELLEKVMDYIKFNYPEFSHSSSW